MANLYFEELEIGSRSGAGPYIFVARRPGANAPNPS
jgi:hypothetical protein